MSLTLAMGNALLAPQSPLAAHGFNPRIDGTGWLAVRVTHSLDDSGLTTKTQAE